jgi:hypothetical protein
MALDRLCALPVLVLAPAKLSIHETLQQRSVMRSEPAPKRLPLILHAVPLIAAVECRIMPLSGEKRNP